MTRAKDVFWILGGPLTAKMPRGEKERPYWFLYKKELEKIGASHRFG